MIHLRISLSPEPASPVKRGEVLKTIPIRLPLDSGGRGWDGTGRDVENVVSEHRGGRLCRAARGCRSAVGVTDVLRLIELLNRPDAYRAALTERK